MDGVTGSAVNSPSVVQALRRCLSPDAVETDDDVMNAYSRDQTLLLEGGRPVAVVFPQSAEDVQQVLRIASQHRTPVVTRGAGTGLAGGATAIDGCIVLVTTKLNRILSIDVEDRTITVEAGVLNADVKRAASNHGLFYPPDPASYESCTIGGNVATNAGGLCCVRYGVTADHVLALKVALADGTLVTLGRRTRKGVAGLNLAPLFIGSEGTLGVVTQVTLRLHNEPPPTGTAVAEFSSLEEAGRAVARLLATGQPISLLEIMDGTTLGAVQQWKDLGLNVATAALVIVQVESEAGRPRDAAAHLAQMCTEAGATMALPAETPEEARQLLLARRLALPALERQGETLLDDVCVPVPRVTDLLAGVEEIGNRHRMMIGVFGHAGDGNLHPTLVLPRGDNSARERAQEAFDDILRLAIALGGTVTGEHGVGLLKRRAVTWETSPEAVLLQYRIKAVVDREGILNPGKALPLLSAGAGPA